MKATYLNASVPLTKTFVLEDGELKKIGHPRIFDYTSYEEEFTAIEELYKSLLEHAALNNCFLKGQLSRQLVNEPRGGTTDSNAPTYILLLDLDGIKNVKDVETFLGLLGLDQCDYIVQYSSSMGVIPDRGLSAHIFIILDKPYSPALLKQWLIGKNLNIPILRANLGLTRTNNALRWPLDVTTCQNDKLIYIAPPILGSGVKDQFKGERIQLIKRSKRTAAITETIPTAEQNRIAMDQALNELRVRGGLPARKPTAYKSKGNVEYMAKPDRAIVTGVKTERGFRYLNINNGDSWAYYHAENNPEFIYNFKSEPIYRTADLLPEYWAEVRQAHTKATPTVAADGRLYLAFRDFRTASYWNGTYDTKKKDLVLSGAKGKDQLIDYLKQNNQPIGEFIPDWNMHFNPTSDVRVDAENKIINTFQPSSYMMLEPKKVVKVPKTIRKVIYHMCGSDEQVFEHFLNWLAVIMQYRVRTETGWVFHGVPGTGKGITLDKILRPLFKYVQVRRMREFDSPFNGFLEDCLILGVDEAQLSAFRETSGIMEADLKNYITESSISIRKMYQMPYIANNYLNVIFASNKPDPMVIDPKDRRFNVGVFQPNRLKISNEEVVGLIPAELEDFYHYLMTRKADRDVAREPLNNAAKRDMVEVGRIGIDRISDALAEGDYQFFVDQISAMPMAGIHTNRDIQEKAYAELLGQIKKGKKEILLREEVQQICQHCLGDMPESAYKFTTKVKHHGIKFEAFRIDNKPVRGIKVKWRIPK